MNAQKRQAIFARFASQNPHPTTELIYHSPFELLIAVILSAQATDKSVNLVTPKLFAIANTPAAMLKLGLAGLKDIIKSIGLFNTKASNIIKTCQMLVEKHAAQIPCTREDLEALPGVGRKTANVILNTAFQQATIAVDTHIFRVANRTRLACGKTPLEVEKNLLRHTPTRYLHDAHHWLVLHGRYVCIARKPHCPTCIINDLCEYPNKTT
jgi:endonuclease III